MYNRPSVPPPGFYAAPQGPPPNNYAPPSGPPPNNNGSFNNGRGYAPPQQYNQGGFQYQRPAATPPVPPQAMTHKGQDYQYSNCSGRKKALLVGINYFGSRNALNGCINDVKNMSNYLVQHHGYRWEDMVILTDDQRDMSRVPTKANMLNAMQWLVSGVQTNDSLFFHYSGHGGQTKDLDGDEQGGFDDVIYPVDFEMAGHIVDDLMHDIMVRPLMPGVRLTALFDSCHSGTCIDLPFTYRAQDGGIKEYNVWKESKGDALGAVMNYARGDYMSVFSSVKKIASRVSNSNSSAQKQRKFSPADVISFSGCKDTQTSADASEGGQATGAMSWAFITVMTQNPSQSYLTLLKNVRTVLQSKYSQKPQLSSSHPLDVNLRFIL